MNRVLFGLKPQVLVKSAFIKSMLFTMAFLFICLTLCNAASAQVPTLYDCENISTWSVGSYEENDLVFQNGRVFSCKPFPFSGWAGLSSAYQPVMGSNWEDAWDEVGLCDNPPEMHDCDTLPNWTAGAFEAGEKVVVGDAVFQCKAHPFSAWCGLSQYQPPIGAYWEDAWIALGSCQTYTIDALEYGNGDLVPNGVFEVNAGTSLAFSFLSDPGYSVEEVILDGDSLGAVTELVLENVQENHTIRAYFSEDVPNGCEGPIVFNDTVFETVVRNLINKPADDIYYRDISTITKLSAGFGNVVDVTGIQCMKSLEEVYLSYNQISDLSPLANLPSLRRLSVGANEIQSLAGLTNLSALTYLALGRNQIADLTELAQFTQLTELLIDHNEIVDISAISGLTRLNRLVLNNNRIIDLAPLENLTELVTLDLEKNAVVDISPLDQLIRLTRLNLRNNSIVEVLSLTNMTRLIDLNLYANAIADIRPLAGLVNLETLNLSKNAIVDLSPLAGLQLVTNLYLGQNVISELTPIGNLQNLTELVLWKNNITDLSPLANLSSLTGLWLSSNPIENIEPLGMIKTLARLDIVEANITDISALAELPLLRDVSLRDNQIEDIQALAGLAHLSWVNLIRNNIVDITPLADNPGVGDGDNIHLWGNPFDCADQAENLNVILDRGANLYAGCE